MLTNSLLALLATGSLGLLSSAKPLPTDRYKHHRRTIERDSTVTVPSTYAEGYLEPYATYHTRYLALKCQDEHDTQFFDDCCHPMLATENLVDNRKPYCTPGSAAYESAFPSSASTAVSVTTSQSAESDAVATAAYVAVTTTSSVWSAPAASSSSVDDDDDWEWCEEDDDSEDDNEETTTSAVPTSSLVASATAIAEAYHAEYQATSSAIISSTSETPAPSTASTTPSASPASTTSSAAAASSSSSSGDSTSLSGTIETGGYATYFYQGGNAGACGTVHSDTDKVIAIDSNGWWPGSFGTPSPYCGKYINIKNLNNGNTVQAMVADVCPTCTTDNSLDLSLGAFEALADLSDGMVPIEWSFA